MRMTAKKWILIMASFLILAGFAMLWLIPKLQSLGNQQSHTPVYDLLEASEWQQSQNLN